MFPTFAVGGAQARFASLANHFGRAYRHRVIAMDGDTSCRERLDPELDVAFPRVALRKGRLLDNVVAIRRLLRELAPAALVTSNWGSIEWAVANAWPVARHVHMEDGFGPEERARQLPRRVWMRRAFLRRSRVLLPSRTLVAIARDLWRLPPARLRYVPNGVDLAAFAPPELPRAPDVPVVGAVAGLRAEKNVGRLIGAMALVAAGRPVRLTVVGDGPERARLEALAHERGVAALVSFAGHLAEPASAYGGFDVFALSSDTEQMPLSVLEAMACGLPVAATDVGDVKQMVSPENVPFIGAPTEEALASALERLLRDAALRRAVGLANRAKAERDYALAAMFDAHRAAWDGDPGP